MGFGILFLGYVLTFGSAFFSTYIFADLIGCAVMIAAFVMLSQYQKAFRTTAMATGVLTAVYAASAVMRMMGYGTPPEGEEVFIGEKIYQWIQNYILPASALIFYFFLLLAISKLAIDVDLPDIAKRCRSYTIVFAVYVALWLSFYVLAERIAEASVRVYNITASGLTLFNAVWLLMMIALILSCMKWIAPAEVVEAEEKGESPDDSVLTRIGEKLDAIQAKANTPREEKEMERLSRELDRIEDKPEPNAPETPEDK